MTALMGASGAGKSTLMDVICGRKTGGKLTGDILVNGHPKHQQAFARVMGCVRVAIVSVFFRQYTPTELSRFCLRRQTRDFA